MVLVGISKVCYFEIRKHVYNDYSCVLAMLEPKPSKQLALQDILTHIGLSSFCGTYGNNADPDRSI